MAEDPLKTYVGMEICSACNSINPKNLSRCPECGIFHDSQIFSDRDVEPVRLPPKIKHKPVDPGMYSLNPNSDIPDDFGDEEEIEDNTTSWSGGSADFSFDESETEHSFENISEEE